MYIDFYFFHFPFWCLNCFNLYKWSLMTAFQFNSIFVDDQKKLKWISHWFAKCCKQCFCCATMIIIIDSNEFYHKTTCVENSHKLSKYRLFTYVIYVMRMRINYFLFTHRCCCCCCIFSTVKFFSVWWINVHGIIFVVIVVSWQYFFMIDLSI